jgi:hypothetical protein
MSLDFQRLASVRARRRARRKRWLSALSALAVAAVIIAASRLAGPMMPGWLPSFERIVPLLSRGASLVGEARGWVEMVEPETGIIRVSSGFLGLRSVALVVTEDTLILVGEKEGGFGDIRQGERIVAAYEVGPDTLQAKRVEVFVPVKESGN